MVFLNLLLAAVLADSANAQSGLLQFLAANAPKSPPEHYDGLEYRYGRLVFRPAEFQWEALALLGISLYAAAAYIGKSINAQRANKWYQEHHHVLEAQFSKPGTTDELIWDGPTDCFQFSTGRRNIRSLHTVFSLLPRHDLLQSIYHFGRGLLDLEYHPRDNLDLDFTLPKSSSTGFVWGIVAKDDMNALRKERWDLTFTKTSEVALLPKTVTVMAEYADITETILKSPAAAAIVSLLDDPAIRPYFRSLTITDQPQTRPEKPVPAEKKNRHIILSFNTPPASKASVTAPLVKAVFALADFLESPKFALRPETTKTLKKVREDLEAELTKEALQEQKDAAEEEKREKKRKAEEERIANLTAAEQKKLEEKERKRAFRKMQGKVVKKK